LALLWQVAAKLKTSPQQGAITQQPTPMSVLLAASKKNTKGMSFLP
jgi:hypothetical protein